MKKLIPALALLLISASLLATSSFAWFSMNTTVSASGMSVKAKASGSLVIGTVEGKATTTNYPVRNSTNTSVSFTADAVSKYDCTHSENSTFTTGLKTLTDESRKDVEIGSGAAKSGKTLQYDEIPTTKASDYYTDYVLYIASSTDSALTLDSLKVSLSTTSTVTFKSAVAVDWYIGGDVSSTTYAGTSHITDSGEKELIKSGTISIPAAAETTGTSAASYKITMRVYIDGAITGTNGVSNANYATTGIDFSVDIKGGVSTAS